MIRESFDQDWYVSKDAGGASSGAEVGPVTVPYDAMLYETRDRETANSHNTGYFPGGVYRYRKSFHAPAQWRGRRVAVEFEGVYTRSQVFVNGKLAAERPSGYATFEVVLDEFLDYDAENRVEVVARNDKPNSRWYSGSGIYRPVHLIVGGPVRVTSHGLRIVTTSIDGPEAQVEVSTEVANDGSGDRTVTVVTRLVSEAGAAVGPVSETVTVRAGQTATARQTIGVPDAELWSPDTPQLYAATVVLTEDGVEAVLDEATAEFGIRTLTVDARHGLRINGKTVKLRGACVHHDNGVIGAHTLEAAEDRRIRILKASGYNAIRAAHNPAAQSMLRACDRHGVLVMDELTDMWWRGASTDYSADFEQWWERDLEALVAKNVNHPSVVMYSIGNEIAETATPRGIKLNRAIAERAHQLDPHRPVTNCLNGFLNLISSMDDEKLAKKKAAAEAKGAGDSHKRLILILNYLMGALTKALPYIVRLPAVDKRTRDAFAAVDIAGYNYMVGRYAKDTERYPDRVIVGSETQATATVAIWREIETMPQVIGDFVWTGWDYVGEAGIGIVVYDQRRTLFAGWPGLLAGTPVIDITGHRQTQSYLNEIAWHRATGPFLAVQPVSLAGQKRRPNGFRGTDSIRSWSWEGHEGRKATVEVYADAARVELLLNGTSLGSKPAGMDHDFYAEFTVPYESGELTAVAYGPGDREIGRDTLTSAGSGVRLHAEPESESLRPDGADLLYVPITLTDDAGIVRPLADREVTVNVTGAGTLLGFGSAKPVTDEPLSAQRHSTYWGRALAVIRAGHTEGDITIAIGAPGCEPCTIVVPVVA